MLLFGCSSYSEPPKAIVKINNEKVKAVKGTYQWQTKGLFSSRVVVADAASPFQISEEMDAKQIRQKSVAIIQFNNGSEPELEAYTWNEEGRETELSIDENELSLPSHKGRHVIEIRGVWPNGDASYTLVIELKE